MKRKFTKYPSNKVYATKAYTKGYTISEPILVSSNGNFKLVIEGGIGMQDTPYVNFKIKRSDEADNAVIDIRLDSYHGTPYEGMPVINLPRALRSGGYAEVSYGFSSERKGNAWIRDTFIPLLDEAVTFCETLSEYFSFTDRQKLSDMCEDIFLDMGIDYQSYIQQEADSYL